MKVWNCQCAIADPFYHPRLLSHGYATFTFYKHSTPCHPPFFCCCCCCFLSPPYMQNALIFQWLDSDSFLCPASLVVFFCLATLLQSPIQLSTLKSSLAHSEKSFFLCAFAAFIHDATDGSYDTGLQLSASGYRIYVLVVFPSPASAQCLTHNAWSIDALRMNEWKNAYICRSPI